MVVQTITICHTSGSSRASISSALKFTALADLKVYRAKATIGKKPPPKPEKPNLLTWLFKPEERSEKSRASQQNDPALWATGRRAGCPNQALHPWHRQGKQRGFLIAEYSPAQILITNMS